MRPGEGLLSPGGREDQVLEFSLSATPIFRIDAVIASKHTLFANKQQPVEEIRPQNALRGL
jgi:hypothetical protein